MKALDGIRILDFSRAMAGPYCTMMLGDLGADVIKVERPDGGDDSRRWGPPFADQDLSLSAYFISANRSKRSLTLDLKTETGLKIANELVDSADVLVENFRTGVMERLGLGFDQLQERNDQLIYCSISGYGRTGPYAERPGYDVVMQAEGGLMSITGPAGGPGYRVGLPIIDITAGMFACSAILAALRVRERSGRGQLIDVSLLDTVTALLSNIASNYLLSGELPEPYGNDHPNLAPYGAYQASDGALVVGVANQRQWRRFCQVIGAPELPQDERFASNEARLRHRQALNEILKERFQADSMESWLETFQAAGIPSGPINDLAQVFEHPQRHARQLLLELQHPQLGPLKTAGFPYHFSDTPVQIDQAPPLLGEHTIEILTEELGYSAEQAQSILDSQRAR